MTQCNYIAIETSPADLPCLYLDELLDLDVLCTEEGIFINIPSE
jgi:hypothetical protein